MDDLRSALRSLLSTPGATAVVVATLAIAIGANTAIFSVVNGVLLRPLGYGDDSRVVVLWSTSQDDTFRLSPADYRDIRTDAAAFGGRVALTRYQGSTLSGLDEPVRVGSMNVTPSLFAVLDAQPAAGRLFGVEDDVPGGDPKVVLTHASWTGRFGGDPALIGNTIEIDGAARVVVGVTEPEFTYPPGDREVELYFPMALDNRVLPDRSHRMFDGIARLAEGVTPAAAGDELSAIAQRLAVEYPDTNEGWGLVARPLRAELLGDLSATLRVLSGAVLLVLLIACANVANLLVARSIASGREFAVRAALGAGRTELLRRSLAESVLLGGAGGAAGLALAWGGTAILRAAVPGDVPRAAAVGLDATTLAFAAVLTLGATVLFGALPAARAMAPDLGHLLAGASASGTWPRVGRRGREAMVVAEVALAVVLLVCAGLMVRSFARMSDVDPGFRRQGLFAMRVQLPGSSYGRAEWRPFFEQLVERVGELPGAGAAGAVSDLPMSAVGLGFEMEFRIDGLDARLPGARPNADVRLVVPGYFEAMGMAVVRGRSFDELDAERDRNVALINETLADRYFAEVDPVGRTLQLDFGEVDIVGVVGDVKHDSLLALHESEVYLPYGRPVATAEMHVVVQSDGDPAAVAAAMTAALAELDPRLASSPVVSIADLLWESVARPRFNTTLLTILAACGALLAAVGTYGIVAYTVSQQVREIGVRMALGADAAATVAMIVRRALAIVVGGALLGIAGAFGASRLLGGLLFEIEPTDPLTYGSVLAAAVMIGLFAAWIPARRATRIHPIVALRNG